LLMLSAVSPVGVTQGVGARVVKKAEADQLL
jgi:hypothetical protein